MLLQGQVGPQTLTDGNFPNVRTGKSGEGVFTELHGRYFETTYRKAMFNAATQAGQTTTVGLATTYVGLAVSNPIGNGVNLAINKVSFAWTVIAAAVNLVGLAIGYSGTTNVTHTTPVTPRSNFFGTNAAPTALADTSATLPTAPFYFMFLGDTPTATTNPNGGMVDLEGSLLVPPGGFVCTVTVAASSAAAFFASIQWEEIPL